MVHARRLLAPMLALGLGGLSFALAHNGLSEIRTWSQAGPTIDTAVATMIALVTAAICAWLALGVMVTLVAAVAGLRIDPRWLPCGLRRAVLWSVGAGVLLGVAAGPASAASPAPPPSAKATLSCVDLGLVPSHVVAATPAQSAQSSQPEGTQVTVKRGDSLWAIAKAHLPGKPSDAQVASAWPAWYQANLAAIGSNPDLLHPGTQLHAPPTTR